MLRSGLKIVCKSSLSVDYNGRYVGTASRNIDIANPMQLCRVINDCPKNRP